MRSRLLPNEGTIRVTNYGGRQNAFSTNSFFYIGLHVPQLEMRVPSLPIPNSRFLQGLLGSFVKRSVFYFDNLDGFIHNFRFLKKIIELCSEVNLIFNQGLDLYQLPDEMVDIVEYMMTTPYFSSVKSIRVFQNIKSGRLREEKFRLHRNQKPFQDFFLICK